MPQELPPETEGSIDELYLEMSPEIKDLLHGWLYKIVDAAYAGIAELPPEHRDRVLMKISKACSEQAKMVLGCHPGMDWEDYKKHMTGLKPPFGPRKITQIGDIVHWTYVPPKDKDGRPICQCPLAMFGWMEGRPELCACSANSTASYIEEYTGREVATVEVLGSPQVGGEDECRFLIHLKPSAFTSPKHET
ncbi:MAG: hypothetical protein E3J81_08625 [Dehalococcoidia bacterium]|nr:MAG: hypothetical protein E3J81_08625 [Dehalococcoidia bacterium]